MNNFYSRAEEETQSLQGRVAGFARLAGIVGAGIASRPYWSKLLGKASVAVSKKFSGRLTSNTVDSAINDLFGEEAVGPHFNFPKQVREVIATAVTRTKKKGAFLSALETYVTDDTKGAFAANKDDLLSHLEAFGKIGGLEDSELENRILNPEAISYLTREANKKGILFQEAFHRDHRRILKNIVSDISSLEPTDEEITEYLGSRSNRDSLLDAWKNLDNEQQRRLKTLNKFIDFGDTQQITFGDLQNDEKVANAVESYLEKIGVKSPTMSSDKSPTTRVQEILNKALELRSGEKSGIFIQKTKDKGTAPVPEIEDFLNKRLKETTTGLAIDKKTGQVFSLAQLRQEKNIWLDTILDEFQLPLVPFKFNIPLKTLKFMQPSGDLIRNLGHLGNEPELRRELALRGTRPETLKGMYGMGVGNQLVTIDTVSKKIRSVKGMNLISYKKRDNAHTADIADVRSQDIDSYLSSVSNFSGAQDNYSKYFMKNFFSRSNLATDINYNPSTGFGITPKNNKLGKILSPAIRKVYGSGMGVSPSKIHPHQLASFIMKLEPKDLGAIKPTDLEAAFSHIFREAKQDRKNISGFLKSIDHARDNGLLEFDSNNPFYYHITRMMQNADDPRKLHDLLGNPQQAGSDISASALYKSSSGTFYRAVNTLKNDPEALFKVAQGQGGHLEQLHADIYGHTGIGQAYEKLQEGILSEAIRSIGIGELDRDIVRFGKSGITAADEFIELKAVLEDPLTKISTQGINSRFGISDSLRRAGLIDSSGNLHEDSLRSVVGQIVTKGKDGEYTVLREELGKFAAISMDHSKILGMTDDFSVKAKILEDIRVASEGFDAFRDVTSPLFNQQAKLLYNLAHDADILSILHKRFSSGRAWNPLAPDLVPSNIGNYYSVFSEAPTLNDWLDTPMDSLRTQIKRKFGMGEFIKGVTSPEKPLGTYGARAQALLQMPQEIGNSVGLGLPGQDRITALRSSLGFYGKRVLPLMVGYEAYKNLNSNLHDMGLQGLDDMAANLLANIHLNTAGIKDAIGLTSVNQHLVGLLPGLDQYFSPRSREEYEQYLMYGEEEVREGRGWLIGSRGALMGGRVKNMRPNFYRRWKSHWTEAENVDLANSEYSWLPSILHPFAPIKRLFNPDWWVQKHLEDRPYAPNNQKRFSPQNPFEDYLTSNSFSEGGFFAQGDIGGGYPASLSGGGMPLTYDGKKLRFEGGGTGGPGGGGRAYGGQGGSGDPVRLGFHDAVARQYLEKLDIFSIARNFLEGARSQSGLYGAVMQRFPLWPEGTGGFEVQSPAAATSFSRYMWGGEYGEALGPFSEFFRRFVQPDAQGFDAFSPYANNMPSWLPEKFSTGDPYMRTFAGEMNLPGDAWERLHPWSAPLRVRGSSVGLSEAELVQKWLNPTEEIEGEDAMDIVEFGSRAHLEVQRQLNKQGLLIGAEVSIYDKQNNITGTVDAVVRGPNGPEVVEIKTQGSKSWGQTPEKYLEQINFYMLTLGISRGSIVFVNRDNPQETRVVPVTADPGRFGKTLQKIRNARDIVSKLEAEGDVSPFETYDLVSRIEILARVAPNSAEFRDHVTFAQKGGLGGFEKQRVEQAIKVADKLNESHNLYPRRYGVKTETRNLLVEDINSDGTILTPYGNISFAGINIDNQAFAYEDPAQVFKKYGIEIGKSVPVTLIEGQFNPELMNDLTLPAIIGNVNKELVDDNYANYSENPKDPLGSRVQFGNSFIGRIWEAIVHSDNLLTNKFMRVRTPLEQFERGEVFGTDKARWNDIYGTIVEPTISSLVSKNPLVAGVQGGILGAMFARTNSPISRIPMLRTKATVVGAAVFAAGAVVRSLKDLGSQVWVPDRYKDQVEFDEYWDILEYMKLTAVAQKAKAMAQKKEGVDLDSLVAGQRENVGLGPWAVLAIQSERKAKRTMFGYESMTGSLQDALMSIPSRQRQIAEEIITTGSMKERQRFYDLLPDSERRVLGKFLGVDVGELPLRPNLEEYFRTHFLPDVDWGGWDLETDIEHLKTRSAAIEETRIDLPSRIKVSKARDYTRNVSIPRMDNPTLRNIRREILSLLSGKDIHVDLDIRPAENTVVNIDMNLFEDQTNELIETMRRDLDGS